MTRATLLAGCALLGASGCLASPYDGTWLFLVDYEAKDVEGDCAPDPDADYTTEYQGTSNTLVDIYTTPNSGIVVLFGDALYGTYDGSSFEAESEQQQETSTSGYSEAWRQGYQMEGDRSGALLTGEVVQFYEEADSDGNSYLCASTWEYSAERVTSGSGKYPED